MTLENLNEVPLEELEAAKEKLVEAIKAKKEVAKETKKAEDKKAADERAKKARETAEEGKTVHFIFKDEEREGTIEKVGKETVTINIDGEDKYIKYEKIIG